jgi:hypothetical protein
MFAQAYMGRKRRDDPDFLYAELDTTAYALFFKENRMKWAEATSYTGNPGKAPMIAFIGSACKKFSIDPFVLQTFPGSRRRNPWSRSAPFFGT